METIAQERKSSKLDAEQLTCVLYGGEDRVRRKREIQDSIANDPNFDITNYHYLTREEKFEHAVRKTVYSVTKKMPELNIVDLLDSNIFWDCVNSTFPMRVQNYMFIPSIIGQGTEKQKEKWLQLAEDYKIIGAYCQTEMGHGTYVRGLETTATYDSKTQEFVIHSPTLTSTKWWPGATGVNATHGIVAARLITKGVDRGIHNFMVQLRSLEDHRAMRGIIVGDIGPKFGYEEADNGFLKFDHVRIPRENLLMRFARVEPDGTYVRPKSEKLSYGTMVFTRTAIAYTSFLALARAVTIAIRYSIVRRQTQNKTGQPETQLLDYTNQQYKLFPLLASAYAFYFVSRNIHELYLNVQSQLAEGNLDLLPELHASSSGIKSITTTVAFQGIEACRVACGGHGYSLSSGFPYLYGESSAAVTYEGDNTVLLLQTARFLIKMRKRVLAEPSYSPPTNLSYLAKSSFRPEQLNFTSAHHQLRLYSGMVRGSVDKAMARVREGESKGLDYFDATNAAAIELIQCAEAHTYFVMVKSFIESLDKLDVRDVSFENQGMLRCLSNIFSLHYMLERSGAFMESGVLFRSDLEDLRNVFVSLLQAVRPEAVSLVDAFDFPDYILRSVLGRKDGDVYNAMWEWAQLNPRNKHRGGVHPVYKKYTKQLIKSKL